MTSCAAGWPSWSSAGVPSVKVYTTYRPNYYQDDAALLRVLAAAARQGVVVMVHCENDALVGGARPANWCRPDETALANHGQARPALAEVEAAHRVLFLAAAGGVPDDLRRALFGARARSTRSAGRGQPGQAGASPRPRRSTCCSTRRVYAGPHPEWGIMQPPLRAPEARRTACGQQLADGSDRRRSAPTTATTRWRRSAARHASPRRREASPAWKRCCRCWPPMAWREGRITWSRWPS